jgi:hypothetical protein
MNTKNIEKRAYSVPVVDLIRLDYEISLALESTPPDGPMEAALFEPQLLTSDPLIMSF